MHVRKTAFYDLQIDLDPNAGIFITMNPAGKGYGGRQKLPDNLKQLFRPVAMSRPDNEQIAEVILFSEGFKKAKDLGRKLVALFTLSMLVGDSYVSYSCQVILQGVIFANFMTEVMQYVCNPTVNL